MACSIPYLDDNYQGEKLKDLRKKHISLVKKTLESKLFYKRNGYLQLSVDKESDIRKNQESFVLENPELSIIQVNNKDVLSLKVDKIINDIQYQKENTEGIIASEKTIRDLAAKISDRIGIPYKIVSDRTEQYKGKLENGEAVINLAYASLDTPIHEILGHPIIRVIKNKRLEANEFLGDKSNEVTLLYDNLLKELETGKGKEVLDRVKKDYIYKSGKSKTHIVTKEDKQNGKFLEAKIGEQIGIADNYTLEEQQEEAIVELLGMMTANKLDNVKDGKLISLLKRLLKEIKSFVKTLLKQKEIEINKLPDNLTIGDLADILAYSNSKLILPGNQVLYTTPDNQTFKTYQEASNHISKLTKSVEDINLNDISLPISKSTGIKSISEIPNDVISFDVEGKNYYRDDRNDNGWEKYIELEDREFKVSDEELIDAYNKFTNNYTDSPTKYIDRFIGKNKEYEQSKEIIEEWKKINNIKYNPEEVYSRGQEFVSIVGAYSDFDVNLMMQNLLAHIEDNEKAGGQFAISAITKPVDKKINHLEGGGGKIRFKIYPKSKDILWASNIDVYSGSVWDAAEKVNKDKKSELLGVSYTKYPSLNNINAIKPNLASIIDDLAHHHNELGIVLTGGNFELDYDDDIPFTTKKIINGINSILKQKYGEIIKPEINTEYKKGKFTTYGISPITYRVIKRGNSYSAEAVYEYEDSSEDLAFSINNGDTFDSYKLFDTEKEAYSYLETLKNKINLLSGGSKVIQPTQTKSNLKESINEIKRKVTVNKQELHTLELDNYVDYVDNYRIEGFLIKNYGDSEILNDLISKEPIFNTEKEANNRIKELIIQAKKIYNDRKNNQKEYTNQALINTKIAALKEVAKKYPRSLIRSEVIKINEENQNTFIGFKEDELPFQKISFEINNDKETLKENTEFSEYLTDKNNEDTFLNFISKIKSNLDNYIDLISNSNVEYPSSNREIKLGELINLKKILNDESLESSIVGLNNLITHSVQWIDSISSEYFEGYSVFEKYKELTKQDISNLSEEELERREEVIQDLSRTLNKSKHFLYLFDNLSEFNNELQRNGFIASDKFNTKLRDKTLFIDSFFSLGLDNDFTEELFLRLDKNGDTLNTIRNLAIEKYEDNHTIEEIKEFRNKLDDIIKNNITESFSSQMNYSLQKADKLKTEIKDLHFKVVTEWLYPDYNKIQLSNNINVEDKLYLTKSKFTALLKIAETDENTISNWLEATIQSSDALTSLLANKISKAINEAHMKSFDDTGVITNVRNKYKFQDLSNEDKDKYYEEMTNMITVLVEDKNGNPIEIDLNDEQEGIIISTIYGNRKYKTTKVKAYKTGKHTSLAQAKKKLVNTLLFSSKENEPGLLKDVINNSFTEDKLDPTKLYNFLKDSKLDIKNNLMQDLFKLTYPEKFVIINPVSFREEIESSKDIKEEIKKRVKKTAFKVLYYEKVEKEIKPEDVLKKLLLNNINIDDLSNEDIKYLNQNSSLETFTENFVRDIKKGKFIPRLLSIKRGEDIYYLVKEKGKMVFRKPEEISNIQGFYYKKYDLVGLQDEYLLETYKGKYSEYFDTIYNLYKIANNTLGNKRLKHGIVPQISSTGFNLQDTPKEAKDFISRIYDYFKNGFSNIYKSYKELENSEVENEDERNLFENQYLNNEKVRNVSIKYTSLLENQENLEKDLSVSLLAYNSMINTYLSLKKYDNQVQLVRTIVKGDNTLNIEERQAVKRDLFGRAIKRVKGGKDTDAKIIAKNTNAKLIEFIDDMVYGDGEYSAFDLGFLNSKDLEKITSGYTAYSSLALNIMGSIGNIMNGKVATYLEGIQGEYYTLEDWKESEKIYAQSMTTHFNDYMSEDLKNKSKIGQLSIFLDAIQGEYLDSFDVNFQKRKFSDIPKSALFFTQSAPEHWIQTVNMIAMLRASKKNNVSLWDRIQHEKGQVLDIDKSLKKELLEFQGKLHSVNKRLNGAYSKIDKSRLQRRWFGRLILAFRKYIYQSYKARFGQERLDIESGDIVRGYVSSYYSELIKDLNKNKSKAWKATRIIKQVGKDFKRFGIGSINTMSFGALSKITDINSLMGLKGTDKEINESRRYVAEVSLYTTFTFLGILLGAITEDDDDELLLNSLELIAKRQKSDMGAFLPLMINIPTGDFIPGFSSIDFIKKMVSSPIPAMRVYDNSYNLLSQLIGYEWTEEGIDMTFNDTYDKSGYGYEKGDYKITRLAEKSILSFYWQIIKLLNPSEQIKYLEMMNKNSK